MIATVCTLASGSSGNCLYFGVGDTHVLVDLGIGVRALGHGLSDLGVRPEELSAVLLTHEHWDHVRGLERFTARHPQVPVLASPGTARAVARTRVGPVASPAIKVGVETRVGPISVLPVAVSHDAAQPCGFRLDCGSLSVAVFTDLGVAPAQVAQAMMGCQLLVVEANHDDDMLWMGPYPMHLKRRISSPRGHLSNQQSASLLAAAAGTQLQRVMLAHLSAENNEPRRAVDAVAPAVAAVSGVAVSAAPRARPGEPFRVEVTVEASSSETPATAPRQLGLFG